MERLGPFEIVEPAPPGVAGRVFVARDTRTEARVELRLVDCVEALPPDERAAAQQRILADLQRAAGIRHSRVVSLVEFGVHEDRIFAVYEAGRGESLAAATERGARPSTDRAIEIVAQAAEALDHAHRCGEIHGDLRPSCVLWSDEHGVSIAGLGLARCRDLGAERPEASPDYLAPEQVRGNATDGRSDLFSLGALLYELAAGERPFPGESRASVLYRIVNEAPPDPERLGVPSALVPVLLRALAKRPEERFESGAALASTLRESAVSIGVERSLGGESATVAPGPAEPGPVLPPALPTTAPRRSSARAAVVGVIVIALLLAAGWLLLQSGWLGEPEPRVVWWETQVRSEPPGLEVRLDDVPLDPAAQGVVRFASEGPFGLLTTRSGCRTVEHRLGPEDAAGEVVLVVDPVEVEVQIDPALDGADVTLNGESRGATPAEVRLDLCQDNTLEVTAEGFRPARIEIPARATPLEVRRQVYGLSLEEIPRGRLELARSRSLELVFYVDGKRLSRSVSELELEEGTHRLRFKNEYHWIDVTQKIEIRGGETLAPDIDVALATLAVQAFPSNCKVYLRRPGGRWKYLDDTPAERRIAAGSYEVKVELIPTGETRETSIRLKAGSNPPVRVSFAGSGG